MSNQITPNPSVPTQVVAEVKFPRWINNLGIIPTSYKDSMSYYECLAWLCKFLEETVIPSVNENGEAVQELQNLYIELNSYVTHYFETLDVQEEINNKLDEMVEDGTLPEIVADYLQTKAVFGFDTVAALKEATNLINGSFARTLGYHTLNDGGSGLYKIRSRTFDDVIDEGFIILLEDETLVAELIVLDEVNVKQLGAYGDGTHSDSDSFDLALNSGKKVFVPEGTYLIDDKIEATEVHELYGITNKSIIKILTDKTIISQIESGNGIRFIEIQDLKIENLVFDEGLADADRERVPSYNIIFETCKNININNVEVKRNCGPAMLFWKYCENANIENCYIHDTKADGVFIQRGSKKFKVNNCYFKNTEDDCVGFVTQGGETFGKVSDLIVTNCIMDGTLVAGSGVCVAGGDNAIISNNIIKNTQWGGIRIVAKQETGETTEFYPDNVLIENNQIYNTGLGDENISCAIYGNEIKSVRIINNTIDTCPRDGISMNGCAGEYIIENNTISNTGKGMVITAEANAQKAHGDTFILNIISNILKDIDTYGMQINGMNSAVIDSSKNFVNIFNNTLININDTDASSITGITAYNLPFVRMQKNVIQTSHTIANNFSVTANDKNQMYDNYPVSAGTEHIKIGNQTQRFLGSPPTTAKAGDVIWNWNPGNDVILWYCTTASSSNSDAVWYALKWRNQS